MADPLWQWDELVAAAHARADGKPVAPITGFSIDTRTLQPGDVFVALKDQRDGHAFVPAAFKAGAAAALVSQTYSRKARNAALLHADDPLAALDAIGRAARVRTDAQVVAITGSVGKTGTKEMLRLCLEHAGPTHASEKSYNNHWGVPLTLARMPQATEYAVLEIGMSNPGEIKPLAQLVRPHVAVITAVEPVHLGQFLTVEAIAEEKAAVLDGLVPGGTVVLPRDNAHFALMRDRAVQLGARVITFGYHDEADVRGVQANLEAKGSAVIAGIGSQRLPYRVSAPGEHYVKNSLAVIACLHALGVDAMRSLPALARIGAPVGRGARTLLDAGEGQILLIDESYNANPASMRAALAAMAITPREAFSRRVAVLGDMLELGQASPDLHRALKEAIDAAGVDLVFACGPMMQHLFDELPAAKQGGWAASSDELAGALIEAVRAGDVVMIKGSLGTRMAPLVEATVARFGPGRPGG